MSKELIPCPFCQKEKAILLTTKNSIFEPFVEEGIAYHVMCTECGASTRKCYTKEQAIELWNRRPSVWHTEMPTEEGLYVVLTKVTNKGIQSSEGAYILDWWDGYCFKNLKQMARHNPVFGNDVYSWVKWQRIES